MILEGGEEKKCINENDTGSIVVASFLVVFIGK